MNNKNALIAMLVLAALLFSLFTISVASEEIFSVSAKAAVLYEPETESILYAKRQNERMPMASTTKIMTALVAIENGRLDEVVTVDSRAVGIEGSSAYLKEGDRLTLEDLLYALMLGSANDAAVAIACAISGEVDSFVSLMNEKVAALGLSDTHFDNPNGLDSDTHYTSAHDLAIISACALKNETFKKIVSTYKKSVVSGSFERLFVNHNKLLKLYDSAVGVKTGYTKKSGRCLVGSAERDGLSLISVTLDAPSDWQDHARMLDYGFDTLERRAFAEPGQYSFELPVLGSDTATARVENTFGAYGILPKGAPETVEHIKLTRYLVAPVKRGDILGSVIFTVGGEEVASVDLVASEDVPIKERRSKILEFFDKLKNKKDNG